MRFVRFMRCFARASARRLGWLAAVLTITAGGATAITASNGEPQAPERLAQNAAPAPTQAQPAPPEKVDTARPAWTVTCVSAARATPPDCRVEQRLFAKETGRELSIASVQIPGQSRQPVLLLHLPNALSLPDGIALSVDGGAATTVPFQSCDGNGCYASLALTPALIDTMKKGKVMSIKVVAGNRQTLIFQHLLTDFATAFEAAK